MLFNSLQFIFGYLPATIILFYFFASFSKEYAIAFVALASIAFYAFWSPLFTLLLLFSIVINYTGGVLLCKFQQSNLRKFIFTSFVVLDLGILFYYKYIGFFFFNWNWIFGTTFSIQELILPLGISFFTFTQLAFLVDVYKGEAKEYNFIHYVLFVTYFPHLIAGPILHHQQMMPQFADKNACRLDITNLTSGIVLFVIGLSKKVLLADSLGAIATPLFDSPVCAPEFFTAWKMSLSYSLQLYFDFSGYSDMAVALALMMGISLPINFNSPYKAKNIVDFWRRWHISLSQFLLHYLYIPLGGNRNGPIMRYRNLLITMVLGGLWHGASWNFAIWGGLHGLYLIINHLFRLLKFPSWMKNIKGMSYLSWLLTFLCVVIAWVFFRTQDFAKAMDILKGMFFFNGADILSESGRGLFSKTIIIYFLIATVMPNSMAILRKVRWLITQPFPNIVLQTNGAYFGPFNQLVATPFFYTLCFHFLGFSIAALAGVSILYINRITYFIYSQF
jgi:alginate O-acetyltransferase complex protein AlgI